ncbi:MAG: hypothetical protein EZS28_031126, partial [Streblomastix strix]
MHNSFS